MHDLKNQRVICIIDDPIAAKISRHAFEESQHFKSLAQHVPEKLRDDICKIAVTFSKEAGCSRVEALESIIQATELLMEQVSADGMQEIVDRFGPIINERFILSNSDFYEHFHELEEEQTEQWKSQISKFKRELSKSARSDIERRRVRSAKTSQLSNKRTFARGGRR